MFAFAFLLLYQLPDFPRRGAGLCNVLPRQLGISFGHLDIRVSAVVTSTRSPVDDIRRTFTEFLLHLKPYSLTARGHLTVYGYAPKTGLLPDVAGKPTLTDSVQQNTAMARPVL